ncbi:MAG: ARMT1-like domain-containing protein [Deltaproteobacteria bacterium]|nr:ARMT1-like domain-containing protein [Deltaproteobacteria bacterium]
MPRPYKIFPQCRACLELLVDLAVGLATADPALQEKARRQALAIIEEDFHPEAISAVIANRFHLAIQEITGNPDPFLARKQAETAELAALFRQLSPAFNDDLESLLQLAVTGNAIDFFRDKTEVQRDMRAGAVLRLSHLPRFRQILQKPPGLILYLADNAGEQFFDEPLVSHLRTSGWQVVYAVKAGPIQNDVTREDLTASGMEERLQPVADTGARTVGLLLDEISPAFRELYDAADIIIAKGMGHFETMSRLADPRLFFLLQAKCAPVAAALKVPEGSFVFCQTNAPY